MKFLISLVASLAWCTVNKRQADSRRFDELVLENQLRVLLVSDPSVTEAAASLAVSSGAQDDPSDGMGMAHFCEHMVHMGSAKYPEEDKYNQFVKANGGTYTAFTYYNHTSYQFQVAPWAFEEALDIFSNLFVSPTMGEGSVEREINAVQSEYETYLTQPDQKIGAVLSIVSNPTHPYARFKTGNRETIVKLNIHQQVKDHYQKHYSSNIMQLVVLSPEPLDQLRDLVIPKFSLIPNLNLVATNTGSPFKEEHLARDIQMNPNINLRYIFFEFILPGKLSIDFRNGLDYIKYYLKRKDSNSFYSTNLRKGLAIDIDAGLAEVHTSFSTFRVTFQTMAPTKFADRISKDLFNYLKKLKGGTDQERYADYVRTMRKSTEQVKPIDQVKKLAQLMHTGLSFNDTILVDHPSVNFNLTSLKCTIDMLSPRVMRRLIISPSVNASNHEAWFNSDYNVTSLDPELVADLDSNEISEPIDLPALKTATLSQQHGKIAPKNITLVHNTSHLKVWHQGSPSSETSILKISITGSNPDFLNNYFMINLLPAINPNYTDLNSDGNVYRVESNGSNVILHLEATQLNTTLEPILQDTKALKFRDSFFSLMKQILSAQIRGLGSGQPQTQGVQLIVAALQWYSLPSDVLAEKVVELELDSFKNWTSILLACNRIDVLLIGNEDPEPLIQLINSFQGDLQNCEAPTSYLKDIEITGDNVFQKTMDSPNQVQSGVSMYLDLYKDVDIDQRGLALLVTSMINVNFFNQIRTQEQLGYLVDSIPIPKAGGGGLGFFVQSNRHPIYVESRIEAFFEKFVAQVSDMSLRDFSAKLQTLIRSRSPTRTTRAEIVQEYWYQITTNRLDFHRDAKTNEALSTVTKSQFMDYLTKYLLKSSTDRKKLSVHLLLPNYPEGHPPTNMTIMDCGDLVEDLSQWKNAAIN